MNMNKRVAIGVIGLLTWGTVTMAQSLQDARKAVTAEQFQKAKSIFNNLITTQATNAENYYYFGDLYLQLNNPDSAKIIFNKGIAANPKFSLNYIGLGATDLFAKNVSAAQANFAKATADMKKKDYKEFIYIGKAYTYEGSQDLEKAFEWFNKAKENGEKDPELHIAMANAYKAQKKNSEAADAYRAAKGYQADLLIVDVNVGEIWTQAYNFELAETTLNGVIQKDPNFGPAYRALAENYYRWASQFPAKRPELLPKAKDMYSKYLDLTDRSSDSRYRYLIFLLNATDWATLEKEAKSFISQYGTNPEYKLAERFLGYAAAENGNSDLAVETLSKFQNSIDKSRLIATDYVFLGRAYQSKKQDSLAIGSYLKAFELDTTNAEVLGIIAKAYFVAKKYGKAAQFYEKISKRPNASFTDWFYLGYSNYFYYAIELANKQPQDAVQIKKTLLVADSAFTYVAEKAKNADAYLYLARVEYYLDPTDTEQKGVKAYDKYIELTLAKQNATPPVALTERDKTNLVEAYSYNGGYYITKDKAKAKEYFDKALAIDPGNAKIQDALKALKAS